MTSTPIGWRARRIPTTVKIQSFVPRNGATADTFDVHEVLDWEEVDAVLAAAPDDAQVRVAVAPDTWVRCDLCRRAVDPTGVDTEHPHGETMHADCYADHAAGCRDCQD